MGDAKRICPVNKNTEAIVNMTPPNNIKQVHVFLGLVNYYSYIYAKRSHLLQPLTTLTSTKVKFKCTRAKQKAFDKIEWIVACDTLLIYLDFNECFDIHNDASDF